MKYTLNKILTAYLPKWFVLAFVILLSGQFPGFIEQYYSRGPYPIMRAVDLFFLRHIPFPAGDLLYLGFPVWLIYQTVKRIRNKNHPLAFAEKTLWKVVLWFYVLWGLNYWRIPVYRQLDLEIQPLTEERLWELGFSTTDSINRLHKILSRNDTLPVVIEQPGLLRDIAVNTYKKQAQTMPVLRQYFYVLKPSLLSKPVSYLGVTGYFNPFTHEAQYNARYPAVFLPHIHLHELAHQSGIAYENEAEFIAWVTAMENGPALMKYSAHLNTLEYVLMIYKRADKDKFEAIWNELSPGVRKNLQEARAFGRKHRLKIDLSYPYDYYLKINQKGKGKEIYSELLSYIDAYLRKRNKTRLHNEF